MLQPPNLPALLLSGPRTRTPTAVSRAHFTSSLGDHHGTGSIRPPVPAPIPPRALAAPTPALGRGDAPLVLHFQKAPSPSPPRQSPGPALPAGHVLRAAPPAAHPSRHRGVPVQAERRRRRGPPGLAASPPGDTSLPTPVTCAFSGYRHVAKTKSGEGLEAASPRTSPSPMPRLQPVMSTERQRGWAMAGTARHGTARFALLPPPFLTCAARSRHRRPDPAPAAPPGPARPGASPAASRPPTAPRLPQPPGARLPPSRRGPGRGGRDGTGGCRGKQPPRGAAGLGAGLWDLGESGLWGLGFGRVPRAVQPALRSVGCFPEFFSVVSHQLRKRWAFQRGKRNSSFPLSRKDQNPTCFLYSYPNGLFRKLLQRKTRTLLVLSGDWLSEHSCSSAGLLRTEESSSIRLT